MTREEAIRDIEECVLPIVGGISLHMAIDALKEQRPHGEWINCSDRLPTEDDGERVVVHISYNKPVCEYVYIPWKSVEFEYKVGHIDAWFPIPKYKGTRGDEK